MKRIAVVEDEVYMREELCDMLQKDGYLVEAITEFEDAARLLAALRPDLVILDLNLPEISGFQICQELKNKTAITVRRGYSTTRLKAEGLSVYTIKPELYEVGLTTGQTPFGHTIPVYDMERTICDLLRSRSSMEIQTFQGALKMYARRKDKDLRTLMRYAGMFRVEKILRQYLEVLL